MAPYRAILRYYRCDTPYRAILSNASWHSPQNGVIPPPWHLASHRHIRAIPHFATYRAIIVRDPTKTSTKEFCDTIAASIARYEKYRYWASKPRGPLEPQKGSQGLGGGSSGASERVCPFSTERGKKVGHQRPLRDPVLPDAP